MPHTDSSTSNYPELFTRYEGNPILTAENWPYQANSVFNAGVAEYHGETLLLVRVEDMRGFSHLTVARSRDGLTNWEIDAKPTLLPDPENHPEESWGIEDSRIIYLDELQQYAVLYTAYSENGVLVSLAMTKDFRTFDRKGPVTLPENKDAALFPRRFNGRWVLIHRPVPPTGGAHIWISHSPDLVHWGENRILLKARSGAWWDANKIGLNAPPIETDEGWLIIYHGVRQTCAGCIYRLGLALLELETLEVTHRGQQWVFGPKEPYEQIGDVAYVTFPCGAIYNKSIDELRIYYGASDMSIACATAKMSDLLAFLK
ncbi:MAG: glycosidase [bacterium]